MREVDASPNVVGSVGLSGLPDSARLWCFGVSRPLLEEERDELLREIDPFIRSWTAHGAPLAAGWEWREGRFLLVGVDDRVTPPSGCSIDALMRVLRGFEHRVGVGMLGAGELWIRGAEGEPEGVTREEFRARAARGEIHRGTVVFDLTLTRLSELRAGGWELPVGEGWHARFLPAKG